MTSLLKDFLRELPNDIFPISRHAMLSYKPSSTSLNTLKSSGTLSGSVIPLMGTSTTATAFSAAHSSAGATSMRGSGGGPDHDVQVDYQVLPIQLLQDELRGLEYYEFSILHALSRHLKLVVEHSDRNRMTLSNLAVIFSPTLKIKTTVLMALISRGDILWSGLCPRSTPPIERSVRGSNIEPVDDDDYLLEYDPPATTQSEYYRPGFFRKLDQESSISDRTQFAESTQSRKSSDSSSPMSETNAPTNATTSQASSAPSRYTTTTAMSSSSSSSSTSIGGIIGFHAEESATATVTANTRFRPNPDLSIDVNKASRYAKMTDRRGSDIASPSPRVLFLHHSGSNASIKSSGVEKTKT